MNAQATRNRLRSDFQRPRYHFLPPAHWMNDPNGFFQWKGRYHLFYQHNPDGSFWANMHWGHAVSDDLVHWEDLPIAMAPTPGGPDAAGVFSGCIVDDGVPTAIYTGAAGPRYNRQTQCIAVSHDDLLTWEKYAGNPVLAEVPEEAGQTDDFRDPFVWKEGDTWYMVLGSRIKDVGGTIFLYRSPDLRAWEYLGPAVIGDLNVSGENWECPNFFPLGAKWVLIVSTHTGPIMGTVQYFVGTYSNFRFTPEVHGIYDHGYMYAPLTTVDDKGRRLLIGWLREGQPPEAQRSAGWSGVQSIPRELSLDDRNRLVSVPVPELATLRGAHTALHDVALGAVSALDVRGLYLDIEAEIALEPDGVFCLCVACADDDTEHTDILYDAAAQQLRVQIHAPHVEATHILPLRTANHPLDAGEPLRLRILLDGSVLEIIANGRTSLTERIYVRHAGHDGLRLGGNSGRVRSMDIWEMPSIWR